jgi:hypothetical protein
VRRQEPAPEQAGFITPDSSFSLRPDRLGLQVRIPPKAWMSLCCNCCVLSGIRSCDKLIPRPEESYRMWCVIVCELGTSIMGRSWPALGCCARGHKLAITFLFLSTFIYNLHLPFPHSVVNFFHYFSFSIPFFSATISFLSSFSFFFYYVLVRVVINTHTGTRARAHTHTHTHTHTHIYMCVCVCVCVCVCIYSDVARLLAPGANIEMSVPYRILKFRLGTLIEFPFILPNDQNLLNPENTFF